MNYDYRTQSFEVYNPVTKRVVFIGVLFTEMVWQNLINEGFIVNPANKFKVGDLVRNKHSSWPMAVVTEITEMGFKYQYQYDKPFLLSPRLGTVIGGEAYRNSFEHWEVVAKADES